MMTTERMAEILKLGAEARENSYIADDCSYSLNAMEACVSIADENEKQQAWLIGLALHAWWNDAMEWADKPHNGLR